MILENGIKQKQGIFGTLLGHFFSAFHTLGVICFFMGVWEFGAHFASPIILPSALEVLKRAYELLFSEQSALLISLQRVLSAIFLGFLCGVMLGTIAANFKSFAAFIKPVVDILQGIAPIVWVVLALFWFGVGGVSVVFTGFIIVLPLSFGASFISVLSLNSKLSQVCKAYKFSLLKRLKIFYLPSILPFLLSNFSIVFAMGVKVVIMAELLGASDGVGAQINDARNLLDTTQILAFVVLMVGLILLFEALVIKVLKITLLPWLER